MQIPSVAFPNHLLLEAVDAAAQERGMSRSEFIRRVLADALDFQDDYVPHRSKLQAVRDTR